VGTPRRARRYRALVNRMRVAERAVAGEGTLELTETVARALFKLMTYKDEYEVARLYTEGTFLRQLAQQYEGDYTLTLHAADHEIGRATFEETRG
jgi:indolepyruvate ferredoxin oxidoreductase